MYTAIAKRIGEINDLGRHAAIIEWDIAVLDAILNSELSTSWIYGVF